MPWLREGAPREAPLPLAYLQRPALVVARELLGMRLVSLVGGSRTVGVIVETEAYQGEEDPASHAAVKAGRTPRNRAMFGPAGRAYVYRSYGVHWCMNVVTGPEGSPQAVLLRGLDLLEGVASARERRGGHEPLAAGPGRLCQAMSINGDLYGHDLFDPPLQLVSGWRVPDDVVGVSGRIGVRLSADWPFRFYVLGSPGVSRPRGNTHRGAQTVE